MHRRSSFSLLLVVAGLVGGCARIGQMAQQATRGNALASALASSATAGAKQLLYDQAAQILRDKGVPKPEQILKAVSLMAARRTEQATNVLARYISDQLLDESQRRTLLVVMEQLEIWSKPLLGVDNEVAQVAAAARQILALGPTQVASSGLFAPPVWTVPVAGADAARPQASLGDPSHEPRVNAAQPFSEQGRALFDSGRYAAALDAFVLAAVSDSGPLRLFDLAKAYGELGNFESAAVLYRKFLSETDLKAAREAAQLLLVQCERRTHTARRADVATAPASTAPVSTAIPPVSVASPNVASAAVTVTKVDKERTGRLMLWVTPENSVVTVAGEQVAVDSRGSLIAVEPGVVSVRGEHPSCATSTIRLSLAPFEQKQLILMLENCAR